MDLEGKVAVVTGSSQGIGQAIAVCLAKNGANIVIDYRMNSAGAEQTRDLVERAGAKATVVQADLASLQQIDRLIETGINKFGQIDILVNNAGIEKRKDF